MAAEAGAVAAVSALWVKVAAPVSGVVAATAARARTAAERARTVAASVWARAGSALSRAQRAMGRWWGRRGTRAPGAARGAKTAFDVARKGGKHAGFLRTYMGRSPAELRKAIESLGRQIAEHRGKITNPERYIPKFKLLDPRHQKALLESKWPGDIQRLQEQADILRGLLEGR